MGRSKLRKFQLVYAKDYRMAAVIEDVHITSCSLNLTSYNNMDIYIYLL